MKKLRHWIMMSTSLLLFWLPGSIESRKGLFFGLVKGTFKKYCLLWREPTFLKPPTTRTYSGTLSSKRCNLFFKEYLLFVPDLTSNYLSHNFDYLVIGLYNKNEDLYKSKSIQRVPWEPRHPIGPDGCTFKVSSRFVRENTLHINDGDHVFVAYCMYD